MQALAPVRLTLSPEGLLLAADPALLRLQEEAGGSPDGRCALPGLAALAVETARLRMRLARPVTLGARDEEVRAWAESRWTNGQVEIALTGWAERPRAFSADPQQAAELNRFAALEQVQCDTALRIVALRGWQGLASDYVSRPLTAWAELQPDPDGTLPLLASVAERQPFRGQRATLPDGAERSMAGRPLFTGAGVFAGYMIELSEREAAGRAAPVRFGRELAPALRQPLGAIIANAETIGAGLRGPIQDSYADYARDIAAAARHLLELVEDLGDLEAIDRPDFRPVADAIDLAECARLASGLLRVRAAERQIRLVGPAEGERLSAAAEFRRVLQILVNLIGNAIRYSPDGSEVRLEVREGPAGTAELSVIDQGPGIAPEDQARMFDKFERLGRSGDGGSGLGLYISRRLARAMGGELSVESAPGEGARFTLSLPGRG